MADLLVRIKKKSDGAAALSCVRRDGSVTWQRQDGQLGRFFPQHDLTHLAVETALGMRRAFYGLLAEGWNISDFAAPEKKALITREAIIAELLVGYFDLERITGHPTAADEINAQLAARLAEYDVPAPAGVTESDVARVRALRAELLTRWRDLPPGETLELAFERAAEDAPEHAPEHAPERRVEGGGGRAMAAGG